MYKYKIKFELLKKAIILNNADDIRNISQHSELWFALLTLAREGAGFNKIEITTNDFGEILNISQQTASRRLQLLAEKGWIIRQSTKVGQIVELSDIGRSILKTVWSVLDGLIKEFPEEFTIKGTLFTGFGEGRYYVNQKGYLAQFVEKFGFKPYSGTLNLRLQSQLDIRILKRLKSGLFPSIHISGFKNGNRTFGPVQGYLAKIDEYKSALLLIKRTHYGEDIVELISEVNLREKLGLKDGDLVTVTVLLS